MDSMNDLIVRRATTDDVPVLAGLIDGFAKGHPAERHVRSVDVLRDALFGGQPIAHVLLAERNATVIRFGAWRKAYDLFWSVYGGDGLGLYVIPAQRGFGVGLCIVAAICADIREHGGQFLQASYAAELLPLYERLAVGRPETRLPCLRTCIRAACCCCRKVRTRHHPRATREEPKLCSDQRRRNTEIGVASADVPVQLKYHANRLKCPLQTVGRIIS